MDLKKIIAENGNKFNDAERLADFVEAYDCETVADLHDFVYEYADGLVPVCNHDRAEKWTDEPECHGLTVDELGGYDAKGNIFDMMASDLCLLYAAELREDCDTLEGLEEEETKE